MNEWMPKNPYKEHGMYYLYKEGSIAGAKAVLKYLPTVGIKQGVIDGVDCYCIPKSQIQQMLKQLEAQDGR